MRETKQVIVIRKDLNMRKGKMVAQGAHASMMFLVKGETNNAVKEWLEGKFTKVCVSVNSERELLEIFNKAKEAKILAHLITDAGLTEFSGVPTKTAVAIGPGWIDEIDAVTGHLSLL